MHRKRSDDECISYFIWLPIWNIDSQTDEHHFRPQKH